MPRRPSFAVCRLGRLISLALAACGPPAICVEETLRCFRGGVARCVYPRSAALAEHCPPVAEVRALVVGRVPRLRTDSAF